MNGALQIGRSALAASQAGIQVAGDNMANAATKGFHRRTMHLTPAGAQMLGRNQFIGRGVNIQAIRREIDAALQARHRDAISREHAAVIDQRFLTAMESLQNELTDNDVSSALSEFFNSFSELANKPDDNAVRGVVIQQGKALADRLAAMRSDYNTVIKEIDRSLGTSIDKANDLLENIARLTREITAAESGQGVSGPLRDQRDLALDELAQYLDITVIEQENGSVDILVGSTPILLAGESRGVALRTETVAGELKVSVRVKADGASLSVEGGEIGGLLRQRSETVEPMIRDLDDFAAQLIFQVNRLHSQGQGKTGFTSVTGATAVKDPAASLNAADAGLPFTVANGSFFIHVTHAASGVRTTHEISANGMMSLNDLVDQINTDVDVPNVTASVGPGNRLSLEADPGFAITFSDDTSGTLAVLGLNTFFTGSQASDIAVNQTIVKQPELLAAGGGHVAGSNDTALAIVGLQEKAVDELGGKSLDEFWQGSVSTLATKTAAAHSAVQSSRMVREGLNAQIQSVSGVSLDEESINLLTFQRQFQAAARYIGVIDETLRTLISI